MAKTTLVVTKDDWTGETVDPTDIAPKQITTFTFNGREYCLDLSLASADELQAALAPWMERASEVNVVGRRARQAKAETENPVETSPEARPRIREWARDNGFDVGPRGRIPDAVVQAFQLRNDTTAGQTDDEDVAIEPEVDLTATVNDPDSAAGAPETSDIEASKPTTTERAAIRQWALEQGLEVKSRGPLSPDLVRDYRQAHAA